MILGIGHDLVDIRRIERLLARFGRAFETRCFTDREQAYAHTKRGDREVAAAYAKRFAAKEALAKAVGTGIGGKIGFQDIEIEHNANGAPRLAFTPTVSTLLQTLSSAREVRCHLSLTDEYPYASAWVMVELI